MVNIYQFLYSRWWIRSAKYLKYHHQRWELRLNRNEIADRIFCEWKCPWADRSAPLFRFRNVTLKDAWRSRRTSPWNRDTIERSNYRDLRAITNFLYRRSRTVRKWKRLRLTYQQRIRGREAPKGVEDRAGAPCSTLFTPHRLCTLFS